MQTRLGILAGISAGYPRKKQIAQVLPGDAAMFSAVACLVGGEGEVQRESKLGELFWADRSAYAFDGKDRLGAGEPSAV
eukprot:8891660-Pyramimonas_sp.AAC.1